MREVVLQWNKKKFNAKFLNIFRTYFCMFSWKLDSDLPVCCKRTLVLFREYVRHLLDFKSSNFTVVFLFLWQTQLHNFCLSFHNSFHANSAMIFVIRPRSFLTVTFSVCGLYVKVDLVSGLATASGFLTPSRVPASVTCFQLDDLRVLLSQSGAELLAFRISHPHQARSPSSFLKELERRLRLPLSRTHCGLDRRLSHLLN